MGQATILFPDSLVTTTLTEGLGGTPITEGDKGIRVDPLVHTEAANVCRAERASPISTAFLAKESTRKRSRVCPVTELWRHIPASAPHLCLSDDLDWCPPLGVSAAMRAVGVVESQEEIEVEPEPRVFGDQIASEGRFPALLKNRQLPPFDISV